MPADSRLLADRYRLLSVVARGGMGQVWEASDELLGRTVAIKEVRFPADVPEEERAVMGERTMREAKLTARLAHRGIITIYDVICVDERPYIVMELVRAPSLARYVDEHGPLPPAEVANIGLQLLDALEVAHHQGIVHRDVKPSNVLLAPGRVVLTDFGIATSESDATLTSTGLLVGSPTYMSPERLRGEGIGPAADMWSLGATLYAALEGQPPFRATTTMGTITAVLVDAPHPLHIAGPLGEAVLGLLDKDVATRLTGAQAADLLEASLEPESSPLLAELVDAPPAAAELPPVMAPVVTWQNPMHLDEGELDDLAESPASSFSFVSAAPQAAEAEPAYGDAGYDGPGDENGYHDGPRDDAAPTNRRRRVGLLAALTLLVAGGLTALLIAATQMGGSGQSPTAGETTRSKTHHRVKGGTAVPPAQSTPTHTAHTKRSPTTAATSPTVSTPTPPTSAATTTTPTSVPTTSAGVAVPGGYQLVHDPLGFQVAVPAGWYRRSGGSTYADYVNPSNSANYLRIDQKAQAGPSAVGAWQQYEPSVKASHPGYQRIRLESVPYRWSAADLEFTWQTSSGTLHVLDRGFITNPRGFALLMQGPDSSWESSSLPVFDVASSTFSPTP